MSKSVLMIFAMSIILLVTINTGCSSDDNTVDGDIDSTEDGDDESVIDGDTDEETMPDGDEEVEIEQELDVVSACHTDIEVGEVQVFLSGLSGSEGIAFDGIDKMYITSGTKLLKYSADASENLVADVPKSIGMAFDSDGNAMLCGWGESDGTEEADRDGSVLKVTPAGEITTLSENVIANSNFISRTPWDTWLISDDMIPEIWEMTDTGETSLWCEDVISPNGMVFSQDGTKLYVAGTFEDDGPLYEITIAENKAGETKKLATLGDGWNDGVFMDADGFVYVIANKAGKIFKVAEDGTFELFVEKLFFPASGAFGAGEGFDPCSIYVTSLLGDEVYRIGAGVEGHPLYK